MVFIRGVLGNSLVKAVSNNNSPVFSSVVANQSLVLKRSLSTTESKDAETSGMIYCLKGVSLLQLQFISFLYLQLKSQQKSPTLLSRPQTIWLNMQ